MTGSMGRDQAVVLFNALNQRFTDAKDELNALDAAIGDGDHGTTIHRGMTAAADAAKASDAKTTGEVFTAAGDAFQRASGGAGGLLFAQIFKCLGQSAAAAGLSVSAMGKGLAKAVDQISRFGRSQPGDKTMLDALAPAAAVFSGSDSDTVLGEAANAARRGAEATKEMAATQGRARFVAGGGSGQLDPGAVSVAMILEEFAANWTNSEVVKGT